MMKKAMLTVCLLLLTTSIGLAEGFTDNGDGTVTDNNTGLMWMQDTAADAMNWQDALDWCENLNLAGYNDWRLPAMQELRSLVNYNYDPAINTNYFPDTMSSCYWSSTINTVYPGDAWLVCFNDGVNTIMINSFDFFVRAVRGG